MLAFLFSPLQWQSQLPKLENDFIKEALQNEN